MHARLSFRFRSSLLFKAGFLAPIWCGVAMNLLALGVYAPTRFRLIGAEGERSAEVEMDPNHRRPEPQYLRDLRVEATRDDAIRTHLILASTGSSVLALLVLAANLPRRIRVPASDLPP